MSAEIDNALVRERIVLHRSLAIFRVAPKMGVVAGFEPGQFTNLGLRGLAGALCGNPEMIASVTELLSRFGYPATLSA